MLDMPRRWDPNVWPKTFSEGCLYGVFGRLIPSARTEKARLKYALQMLAWWRDCLKPENADFPATIRAVTPPRMANQGWTPEQIIEEKRRDGFSGEDYNSWSFVTQRWMHQRVKRRDEAQPPAKPLVFPIKFKACLRLSVGGRLHKDRLNVFRGYWCTQLKGMADYYRHYNMPGGEETDEQRIAKADRMIDKFMREGVDESWFSNIKNGIAEWRRRNMVQQRKNARASRTLKSHRRKILFLLQNRISTLRRMESAVSLKKSAVSLDKKLKKVHSRKLKSDIS
ncbi:MAG: hypothetical protein ABSA83_06540 [Verrucomicrobiota bacterium]